MDLPSTSPITYILLVAELGHYGLQPVAHLLLDLYPEPRPTPEDILSVLQRESNRSGILNELKRAEEFVANHCNWDEYSFVDDEFPMDRIDPPNRLLPFINACLREKLHGSEPGAWPYREQFGHDTLAQLLWKALVVDITDPSMMVIGKIGDDPEDDLWRAIIQVEPFNGPLGSIACWSCAMTVHFDPVPLRLPWPSSSTQHPEEDPEDEHFVGEQNETVSHECESDEDTLVSEEKQWDYPRLLADQAFDRLVECVVTSDDPCMSWLRSANQLEWFESAVQDKFYDEPEMMYKPGGPSLFAATLDTLPLLDLIIFRSITATEVIAIIRALPTSQRLELHLPDMASLQEEGFRELINTGSIRALNLGMTPKLALKALQKIVLASSVEEFTCPELYRASCGLEDHSPFFYPPEPYDGCLDRSSSNFPLQQVVFIISQSQDETEWNNKIQWCHAKMNKNREHGFQWGIGVDAVSMPLGDSFLPLVAIPGAIGRVLSVLTNMPASGNDGVPDEGYESWRERLRVQRQLAECFTAQPTGRLPPLPNFMFHRHRANQIYARGTRAPEPQQLSQFGWTLFLHDFRSRGSLIDYGDLKARSHLRYAFAKLDASGTPIVLSAEEWFTRILGPTRADLAAALTTEWETMLRDVQAYLSEEMFVVVKKATDGIPPVLGSPPTREASVKPEQEMDPTMTNVDVVEWEDEEHKGYELGVCSATEALDGCRLAGNRISLINLRTKEPVFRPDALGMVLRSKVGPWQMQEILQKFRPAHYRCIEMKTSWPRW